LNIYFILFCKLFKSFILNFLLKTEFYRLFKKDVKKQVQYHYLCALKSNLYCFRFMTSYFRNFRTNTSVCQLTGLFSSIIIVVVVVIVVVIIPLPNGGMMM